VQEQSIVPLTNIVGQRKLKQYYARDYEGLSERINNLDQVDLTQGKWLIQTRTISRLNKMKKELRKRNLYYETNKGKSFKVRIYNASVNYNSWCRGIPLEEKEIKDIVEFTGLKQEQWDKNINWFDAFKETDYKEREYIKHLLDNNEDLDKDARIQLSTIHAAKGGEEDNVIICLDIGDKIKKAIKKSQDKHDEEHRVWYVGSTRARNNLYKLKARIKRNEYKHL
jgi:ATP-dependent exoDNAse (exonuclease V) beta subunit